MLEQLQTLEDKIAVIASRMNKMRSDNLALKTENTSLRQALAGQQDSEQRIQGLTARVAELESILVRAQNSEMQLRQRFASILSKLESIENEVSDAVQGSNAL